MPVMSDRPRGSTPRTRQLAADAVEGPFTPWDEWQHLWAAHPADPWDVLAMAQKFAAVWAGLTPLIREGELLVGARRRAPVDLPEAGAWHPSGEPYTALYAERHTPPDRPDLRAMAARGLLSAACAQCHRAADYPAILREGTAAFVARARALAPQRTGAARAYTEAFATYHAALIAHAARYAEAARAQAAACADPGRAAELREIARICEKVPARPADTFHEALQSCWFTYHAGGGIEDIGRIDQYLYPYYRDDIAAGRLTEDRARELIECLLIKCFRDYIGGNHNVSAVHTLTLGGVTPEGADACNDLTRLVLEAAWRVRLTRPSIYLRCHPHMPEEMLALAAAMQVDGLSEPNFYGDLPIIAGLERLGIPTAVARDYALGGCTEVISPGRGNWAAPTGWINMALLVDDAVRAVAAAGDASPAALWQEVTRRIDAVAEACREITAWLDDATPPDIPGTMLMPCSLERGADTGHGGAETTLGQWAGVGLSNAANMLYTALHGRDGEPLAALIGRVDAQDAATLARLRALPKFGQAHPVVDAIAARLVTLCADALERRATPLRAQLVFGHLAGGQNMHIDYGHHLEATLDGRPADAPLADSLAGSQGHATAGPTALLQSLCALDHSRLQAGNVSTVMLNPADFRGEAGRRNLVALIKTFVALGGSQLQCNFVDRAMLRAAMADPQAYRGLMVRVAGYSADFTTLGPIVQEEIISRLPAEAV